MTGLSKATLVAAWCIRTSQELVSDSPSLSQTTEQCPVNRGGIVSNGVLPGKEESWECWRHVVRAGRDGRGQDVVVVAR